MSEYFESFIKAVKSAPHALAVETRVESTSFKSLIDIFSYASSCLSALSTRFVEVLLLLPLELEPFLLSGILFSVSKSATLHSSIWARNALLSDWALDIISSTSPSNFSENPASSPASFNFINPGLVDTLGIPLKAEIRPSKSPTTPIASSYGIWETSWWLLASSISPLLTEVAEFEVEVSGLEVEVSEVESSDWAFEPLSLETAFW